MQQTNVPRAVGQLKQQPAWAVHTAHTLNKYIMKKISLKPAGGYVSNALGKSQYFFTYHIKIKQYV